MGKEGGELWDDSALIKAFDHAISTYKVTHGLAEEKKINSDDNQTTGDLDCGSRELHSQTECMQGNNNRYHGPETNVKVEETASSSQAMENSLLESSSSAKLADTLGSPNGSCPLTDENPYVNSASPGEYMIESDVTIQNEATNPYNPEEYNLLLSKYYELEGQRQNVLQQLNLYGNWNYQQDSNSQDYQASVPQAYENAVTCYCPYGCQNWVVPCNSFPDSCSGRACTEKSSKTMSKGDQNGNVPEEDNFVKTAMAAAERALSSVKKDISSDVDEYLKGGKGKEIQKETDHSTESTHSATDLSVVLQAWYLAGFHTAKYLFEESAEKRK